MAPPPPRPPVRPSSTRPVPASAAARNADKDRPLTTPLVLAVGTALTGVGMLAGGILSGTVPALRVLLVLTGLGSLVLCAVNTRLLLLELARRNARKRRQGPADNPDDGADDHP